MLTEQSLTPAPAPELDPPPASVEPAAAHDSTPALKQRANMASAAARAARRPGDVDALTAAQNARRDYYAVALEAYIQRALAAAPPLTESQRSRLSVLLRGGEA